MKARLASAKRFLCYLIIILLFSRADSLLANYLEDYTKAADGYDIYESFEKSDANVRKIGGVEQKNVVYFN